MGSDRQKWGDDDKEVLCMLAFVVAITGVDVEPVCRGF